MRVVCIIVHVVMVVLVLQPPQDGDLEMKVNGLAAEPHDMIEDEVQLRKRSNSSKVAPADTDATHPDSNTSGNKVYPDLNNSEVPPSYNEVTTSQFDNEAYVSSNDNVSVSKM